jgi:hypothetical protein
MSQIVLAFQGGNLEWFYDDVTKCNLYGIVKDSPINIDVHSRLLGLLQMNSLILSDDEGYLTVVVAPQKEEKNG